ncbi:MAG: tail fiber domain-containing protein [Bacteroidales bacterium]|nr:tail fiber domain-containing protein [Bacteroidales bacterium]
MAYGRWLYKEIETKQGSISLAIYKKNYTGNAIEIDALVADSIVISIDGDGITAPIIGSSLSFSIVDTGQIDTSEFFTPDATMYRVDLSRDGTLEWSGYLTSDSYQENLAYMNTINLIARDNLGRLEEFQFLKSKGLQNMETFIGELLSEVGCPQYINWDVRKVSIAKGKGISEVTDCDDIWVNTELFVEKNYKEIVEMILTGLGCQMRYNGYNNLIITSLSDIPSFPTQSAIFINKSGFKEILPAWKDVTINQDYGLIEDFFDGYLTKEQIGSGLTFIPNVQLPDKWTNNSKLSNLLFANPYEWAEGIEDGAEGSMFPALSNAGAAIWKKKLKSSSAPMEVKMYLNNTLRRLRNSTYKGIGNLFCGSDDTKDHILEYELRYQFLVSFVDSTGKERFMTRYGWADIEDDTNAFLESLFARVNFTTSPCKWDDEGTWDQEQEVTISINNLTEDGELRIYIGNVYWGEKNEVPDNVFFGKIRDIRIAYKLDNGEIASRLQVSDKHNINGRVELEIGQVPVGKGDYFAYAGGFFDSNGLPLTNFKRYYDDINNYILMELVAREHIHFNKDNYMALSGDMISDSPFSFRNNIIYKGERYALISASLAVISNTLSVTNMLQVTDYEVAELTTINSPLESSSGTKVGSGSRQVIQFSNDAGNAKRLYELDFAMDSDDIDNAYAIVDTDRWQEAKRVKVSELGGLFNKAFEVVTDDAGNVTAVIAKANLGARGGIAARYQGDWGDTPVTPTINSLSDINDVTITSPTNGQVLTYRDGVWVNEAVQGGGDMSGYLPLSGGEIKAGDNQTPLIIDNTNTTLTQVRIQTNGANKANIGWSGNSGFTGYRLGVFLHSVVATSSIGIKDDGTPYYNNNTIIHSGNIGSYAPIYNANGNVLIGTPTDNGYKLDVNGTMGVLGPITITGTTSTQAILNFSRTNANYIVAPSGSAVNINVNGQATIGTAQLRITSSAVLRGANVDVNLGTQNTPWSNIYGVNGNFSGNVGIGTTSPLTKLDVDGDQARITSYGTLFRDTDKPNGYNPTYMSEIYQWQDTIYFTRNNPTTGSFLKSVASINLATGSISSSGASFGGNVYLRDTTGSASESYKLWFIRRTTTDDYWDYGIYAQTTKGLTFFQSNQGVNTDIAWLDGNGNLYVTGGIAARYASDIRLKEDVKTITTEVALATIMALNPITFRWNAKATELCSWLNGESQGFIAQDYEALIPNSGSEMWGEYRGIDYNRAIPYIVAMAQNHETRIKQLEEELDKLKREYYGNR